MYGIKKDHITHMQGVAEYMYDFAAFHNLNPEQMYLIGILHDIGYITKEKINREEAGADLLKRAGFKAENIIRSCGMTPYQYCKKNECTTSEIPKELILLWEADMHVDETGKRVSYSERLSNIKIQYGEDSLEYEIANDTVDWLIKHGRF